MELQERLALEFLSGELQTSEVRLYEHVTSTFRWLMATLFAANGGAILALMGETTLPGGLQAMGWFAMGVVLSLLMGALSAFMAHRAITPVAQTKGKIHQALITGDTAEAEESVRQLVDHQKMTPRKWLPTYCGLASLSCFVAGISTIAWALLR